MSEIPEFQPWPKIARMNREVVVTEKIDGTNAAIVIPEDDSGVFAQSRKKMIFPGKQTDNYGFAQWVAEREARLKILLGYGTHFGEWYGSGIQGNPHKLEMKRFMLFNVSRWDELRDELAPHGIDVAHVLYRGPFDSRIINDWADALREYGSVMHPDTPAEGLIVYHTAANIMFKVLCENDEGWKG